MDKNAILKEFSANPDRYYKVKLFDEEGFSRKSCSKCGRFFWTLDSDRSMCPDDADDTYSFIGDPPTRKKFDYTQAWMQVKEFFVENNHTAINRYPVVCRWRDDLYFTIASIVDFQRVMGSKVAFEFPANPLVVPQTCLRFKDLENVGVTGRHFSSFCMIGQHSIANSQGYWKDECIDLDYRLLTEKFGIKKEEIVFVEDVWEGGGSFGSSLEYFTRGLELGNAVFTEFQGQLGEHSILDQKIIDMGAGLERFAWITNGTPTAYDCCFGPITQHLTQKIGLDLDSNLLKKYFTEIARNLETFDNLNDTRKHAIESTGLSASMVSNVIIPLEGIYLIADHLRTLLFAIADGALPSNVGGGYNLRMILRRINGTIDKMNFNLDIDELVDMHIDYLKDTYKELDAKRQEIKTILNLESRRYVESKSRMNKMAQKLKDDQKTLKVDELITLYESDGITPEYLQETGVISEIPSSFYVKLSDLHQSDKKQNTVQISLEDIAQTEMLFYKDDPMTFDAKVLKVLKDSIVLDRTSFYARGGGQEPDHGTISGFNVIDVSKHGNVIIHKIQGGMPKEGQTVTCSVDALRRANITKNHTSTHILNSSARQILGSWVWQHSAFKDADHARLDITHHSSLSDKQIQDIEKTANDIISKDMSVSIENYDRGEAEQKYGFKIYQGGVVPVKSVRIVSIEDFDTEACGGTHVKSTKEIELLRITKTKRIQDGVIRLEFVSGPAAKQYDADQKLEESANIEKSAQRETIIKQRNDTKIKSREQIPILVKKILSQKDDNIIDGVELTLKDSITRCFTNDTQYGEFFHMNFGKKLVKENPNSVYVALFESGDTVRIIAYSGLEASKSLNVNNIVKTVSEILGGTGGGDKVFSQGGGKNISQINQAIKKARSMIGLHI